MYWDERARRLGRRAPGHVAWSEATYERMTDAWWRQIQPWLPLPGRALDFGCGTGRFARRLADAGFTVDAFDPSHEMLRRAESHPKVTYTQQLPTDRAYNLVWCMVVLQHMDDVTLIDSLRKLSVVGRDAAWVVCENISPRQSTPSTRFRSASEYIQMLSAVHVDTLHANGEQHGLFIRHPEGSRFANPA